MAKESLQLFVGAAKVASFLEVVLISLQALTPMQHQELLCSTSCRSQGVQGLCIYDIFPICFLLERRNCFLLPSA